MAKNKKYSILIVDDMPINLQILTGFLKSDYRVRVATSGIKALEIALSDNVPDLILLDIVMPEINGFEICRRLKADKKTKHIPVIFITVLSDIEDKVKGFAAGGADYVTKPFQQEEVLARVRTHLKIQHQKKLLYRQALDLAEARNIAEQASKAKSNFLANMSHELRSPLNTIIGFSQLMGRRNDLPQEYRENAQIITKSGEHLLNLINDVLDMSKIEAGRIVLNEHVFDLHYMIKDIVKMFALKAEQKNLQLFSQCSPEVPRYIRADEIKLRQVLINLLSNALKFTEKGSIGLRVSIIKNKMANLLSNDLLNIYFEVEDTGPGIYEHDLENLFKAFVQAEAGLISQQGTGLGLPISKKYVRLMGGNIKVCSKKGIGTVFSFDIKAGNSDPVKTHKSVSFPTIIGLKPEQPAYKVLIADNNQDNRRLLVSLLKPLGFDIQEAENIQKTIKIWNKWNPNLIWLELRMPGIGVYEDVKKIKNSAKGKHCIVIAMTASSYEKKQASEIFDDFLEKPFHDNDVFELMKKHIKVQYIYEMLTANESEKNTAGEYINAERLKKLPEDLFDALKKAVEETYPDKAEEIIKLISGKDPMLGRKLEILIQNFRFDILQKIFEEID